MRRVQPTTTQSAPKTRRKRPKYAYSSAEEDWQNAKDALKEKADSDPEFAAELRESRAKKRKEAKAKAAEKAAQRGGDRPPKNDDFSDEISLISSAGAENPKTLEAAGNSGFWAKKRGGGQTAYGGVPTPIASLSPPRRPDNGASALGENYTPIGRDDLTSELFGADCVVYERVSAFADDLYNAARSIAVSDARVRDSGHVDAVISIDTEYQFNDDSDVNDIVSYQFTIAHGNGGFKQFLVLTKKRLLAGGVPDWCFYRLGITGRVKANVVVLAHFWAAEWSMLSDRDKVSEYLTEIRRTPVSIGSGFNSKSWDSSRNCRQFRMILRDTVLVSPGGTSLSSWGDVLGLPKISLPDGAISNMRGLLESNPRLFAEYAMRDTEVCLLAYGKYMDWCTIQNHIHQDFTSSVTLGGTTVNLFREFCGGRDALNTLCGQVKEKIVRVDGRKGTQVVACPVRVYGDPLAGLAFHGGFNQARFHGPYVPRPGWRVFDVDLAGAYAAAMSLIPNIDFSRAPDTTNSLRLVLARVKKGVPVVADIEFEFPASCADPCLPVASERGLQYPLVGRSYCTGPEIKLAHEMGAQLVIHKADCWRVKAGFIYADYLSHMMAERGKHPKKSLENLLFKEMVNSLYGKIAQGIRDRNIRNFSLKDGDEARQLGPSAVTLPIAAAMITGYIRAALHEMNQCFIAAGFDVLTTTTDGSMVGAPVGTNFNEIVRNTYGFKVLSAGRKRLQIADYSTVLEVKSEGASAWSWRTRANSIYDENGASIHNAQGGIKFGSGMSEAEIGVEMLHISNAERVLMKLQSSLVSAKKISHGKADDLVNVEMLKKTHYDFDFKRELEADGWTRPWKTIDDIKKIHEIVDGLHRYGHRATYENVAMKRAGVTYTIRSDLGVRDIVYRAVRRAAAQGFGGWRFPGATGHDCLRGTSKDQRKKDKKRALITLPDTAENREILREVAVTITQNEAEIVGMIARICGLVVPVAAPKPTNMRPFIIPKLTPMPAHIRRALAQVSGGLCDQQIAQFTRRRMPLNPAPRAQI